MPPLKMAVWTMRFLPCPDAVGVAVRATGGKIAGREITGGNL
ncbi:hypothetical protein ASZ90_005823 [hydrocarbon metagenome]|uniref:Uncharacterized protein n=1 Tax=hydrocarbon metagenome TaxID=938273 RepID=A0A0W8FU29_9ZZZZ